MVKRKLKGGSVMPVGDRQIKPNIPNIFKILAFMSPYILIGFFLLLSIFNFNLKGIIYIMGVCILIGIVTAFNNTIYKGSLEACNFFGDALNDIPCFSSGLYMYTFMYLFMAMINSNILNIPLLILLLSMFFADATIRFSVKCTDFNGIIFGGIIGLFIGATWYIIFANSAPHLLYFDEYVSNKVACSVPKNQDFKCRLFKDGQEIDSVDTGFGLSTGKPQPDNGADHTHNI